MNNICEIESCLLLVLVLQYA